MKESDFFGNMCEKSHKVIDDVAAVTGFITGGTFSSDVSGLCADWFTATENEDGSFGIEATKATVSTYEELEKALAKAAVTDIAVTERIVIAEDTVLDLNGKTVTADNAGNYAFQILNGSLTVKNGTVDVTGSAFRVGENNEVKETVELTLAENVTVTAGEWGAVIWDGTLNVASGSIHGGAAGISGNGLEKNKITAINITAGTVTGGSTGIYMPMQGTLNVSGGTISGQTGIYAKAGKINIKGGTIEGTGEAAAFVPNYNGANPTGDALVLDLTAGYKQPFTATVTGGTFVSANAAAVGSYSSIDDMPAVTDFISGGSFEGNTENLGNMLEEGFAVTNGSDGRLEVNNTEHSHAWDDGKVTKEATCKEEGVRTFKCTFTGCKETKTEKIGKKDHVLSWTEVIPAGCENEGLEKGDCENCDHYDYRSVTPAGHTEVKDAAVAPSCFESGLTEGSHCSVCGTVLKEQQEVPATEKHTFGNWKVLNEATCAASGDKVRVCTVKGCGFEEYEEIAPLAEHTGVVIEPAVAATCFAEGMTEGKYCAECGEILVEPQSVAVTEHSLVWTTVQEASCRAYGIRVAQCANEDCGYNTHELVPMTAHIPGDWTVTKAAVCALAGEEAETCKICGTKTGKVRELPATGIHVWGEWEETADSTKASPKKTRLCQECGTPEIRTMIMNATSLKLRRNQKTSKFEITGLAEGDSVASVKSDKTNIVKVQSFTEDGACVLKAGKKNGTAKLTITLASGMKREISVKVQKAKVTTTSVKVASKTITLKKGEKFVLELVIKPLTSQSKLTFSTSKKSVATVSKKGVVTAKKKGTAKITVKSGSKRVRVTVKVTK